MQGWLTASLLLSVVVLSAVAATLSVLSIKAQDNYPSMSPPGPSDSQNPGTGRTAASLEVVPVDKSYWRAVNLSVESDDDSSILTQVYCRMQSSGPHIMAMFTVGTLKSLSMWKQEVGTGTPASWETIFKDKSGDFLFADLATNSAKFFMANATEIHQYTWSAGNPTDYYTVGSEIEATNLTSVCYDKTNSNHIYAVDDGKVRFHDGTTWTVIDAEASSFHKHGNWLATVRDDSVHIYEYALGSWSEVAARVYEHPVDLVSISVDGTHMGILKEDGIYELLRFEDDSWITLTSGLKDSSSSFNSIFLSLGGQHSGVLLSDGYTVSFRDHLHRSQYVAEMNVVHQDFDAVVDPVTHNLVGVFHTNDAAIGESRLVVRYRPL